MAVRQSWLIQGPRAASYVLSEVSDLRKLERTKGKFLGVLCFRRRSAGSFEDTPVQRKVEG